MEDYGNLFPPELYPPEEELTALLPEHYLPEEDLALPPPEHETRPFYVQSERKTGSVISKVKAYMLTAAVGVTAITGAAAAAQLRESAFREPDKIQIITAAEYVEEYELAYYAQSGEEAERMAEQELWYRVFGALPGESASASFSGIFDDENMLARAFVRDTVYNTEPGGILDLPYYEYTLTLPEDKGGEAKGRIYILDDRESVIVRLRYRGVYSYYIINPDMPELSAPYDVTVGRFGRKTAQVRVFGNGACIDASLKYHDADSSLILRCSSDASMDAGRKPISMVITIINTAK